MANRIVVPGEKIFDTPRQMQNAFVENGKTYSSLVALLNESDGRLVALEGAYLPANGDYVVGVVKEVKFAGYVVDIRSPYIGFISARECRDELALGNVIIAVVKGVDEVKNVDLAEARRLVGGEIIEVTAVKVPRVIGKKNSMLDMLKEATKSDIVVGRNGRAWVKGGDTGLVARALTKIENEAHISGLTERVAAFLEEEKAKH